MAVSFRSRHYFMSADMFLGSATFYCGTRTQQYSASALKHEKRLTMAILLYQLRVLGCGYRWNDGRQNIDGLDSKVGKLLRNAPT
jgi:hypothetical protein